MKLEVTRATDANQKAITDWVTAYNSLQSTINSLTKYVPVDAGAGSQSASNGRSLVMRTCAEFSLSCAAC
jgi:flagellar hook-associated protein 2